MSAELLDRTTVHKGRYLTVEVDIVKLPSGHTVDMDIVRHPGSVVILAIPEPGKIVLIRQYRYTIDRWIWELPAGTLKPNEPPEAAAARECEEEIGLAPGRVTRLRGYYPTPGFCDEEMTYFRCEDLRQPSADSPVKQDDDEKHRAANIYPRRSAGARAIRGHRRPEDACRPDFGIVPAEETSMFTRRFVVGSLLALVLIGMSGAVSAQDSERFFVTGFVRTPGSFILEPNMTVGDGIDIAGGVTDRGSLSGVLILRKVSGATQTIEVALTDKLQANDTIRVRQKI